MNIRRFVAADMRRVLREVRASLGPDAVIVSTRNIDEGVEVIAAMDYDDTLIGRWADGAARRESGRLAGGESRPADDRDTGAAARTDDHAAGPRSPAATYASIAAAGAGDGLDDAGGPRADEPATRPRPAAPRAPAGGPAATRPQAAPGGLPPQVAAELSGLRELLEHQLSSLAWNDANRRNPVRTRTLRQYARLGIDPQVAKRLAARLPAVHAGGGAWRLPLQALAERLPLAKQDLADLRGAFAIIGPTGVGKTTTIAKIAARFALRHGVEQLGLVTTDAFRIGARDQLLTFARILGTPMHVANDAAGMQAVLAGLSHKRLILVDTAGMGQRDARLAQQFAVLGSTGQRLKTVLALSAAGDLGGLRDVLAVFRAAAPVALIATKIDEAASLGPLLSAVLDARLPLAYLCDGQRVPEDIHLAVHRRAWIIRTAMQLARQYPRGGGESELAAAFGGLELAANG